MSPKQPKTNRTDIWCDRLAKHRERVSQSRGLVVEGRLTRMVGLTLEAIGCRAASIRGSICR